MKSVFSPYNKGRSPAHFRIGLTIDFHIEWKDISELGIASSTQAETMIMNVENPLLSQVIVI